MRRTQVTYNNINIIMCKSYLPVAVVGTAKVGRHSAWPVVLLSGDVGSAAANRGLLHQKERKRFRRVKCFVYFGGEVEGLRHCNSRVLRRTTGDGKRLGTVFGYVLSSVRATAKDKRVTAVVPKRETTTTTTRTTDSE